MKITLFLIWFSFLISLATSTFAQNERITLELNQATIQEALKKIESETDFYFLYNNSLINVNKVVDLNVRNKGIEEILDQLFRGEPVKFMMLDNQIILFPDRSEKQTAVLKLTVSGKVTDDQGGPMPGVAILIKGTQKGTVTDFDGNYSLETTGNSVFVFSFIGMKSQEIAVNNRSEINIELQTEGVELEEVVAIGYGTSSRKFFTGSVSSLKMEESPISNIPNLNVLQSLKGTITGMNIGTITAAGESPDLLIRGQNSINGSNMPLIVLDGVIFMGEINDINPNDILTFDILKDASSTAVYGTRAANGVILITTKKGKPTITMNSSTGIQVWQQKPNLRDGAGYLEKVSTYLNSNDPLNWLQEAEKENYLQGKTIDWLDWGTRIGKVQNHHVMFAGNSDYSNFFLSGGYTSQEGVMKGDDYSRISLRGSD